MTRSICVVTGTRAEYGLLESPMRHIRASEELDLTTVATGMHLSPEYGLTVTDIEDDGFEVDRRVDMLVDADTGLGMAKSTGIGILGLAEAFRDVAPDVVLILGDRDEPLAAGIAAAHMNIPVGHIHGGDVMTGAVIDDSIRYALTKFAHIHFPASEESAERVSNLGEEEWRITVSGAPGVDAILEGDYVPGTEMRSKLEIDQSRDLVLCVQHPVTTQPEAAGEQMEATLDALTEFDTDGVLVFPNSDAGGKEMIEVIKSHEISDRYNTVRNLPRREYLGVMEAADVMVGNSSSGIIESPSLNLPVVDVGPREARRQRAGNVTSVPHERDKIREAVNAALTDESIREQAREVENPYDYGGAGERIAEALASVSLDESLLRKNITY